MTKDRSALLLSGLFVQVNSESDSALFAHLLENCLNLVAMLGLQFEAFHEPLLEDCQLLVGRLLEENSYDY